MIQGLLLHSVSYAGTWGQPTLSLDAFLDRAAGLGFDGVMLMAKRPHLSVLDYDDDACRRLRDRLAHRGLRHVVVAGYNDLTAGFARPDIPQVEYQIAHLVRLAEMTSLLGGTVVRVFTGYESDAVPFERQWQTIRDALREVCDRAATFGVTIGVQNHHDIGVESRAFRDLIEDVRRPNCAALFDAWAPALHGENPADLARWLGALTVHTTVANYQPRDRYCYRPALVNYEKLPARMQAVPIDEGFIDYQAFFEALDTAGFRGTVAYEMCSPLRGEPTLETLDRYAAGFLDFMRRLKPARTTSSGT